MSQSPDERLPAEQKNMDRLQQDKSDKADISSVSPIESYPSRVVVLTVTEAGRSLAQRLPFEHIHGTPGPALRSIWNEVDGIIMILAVGAAVRLIAPLLTSKDRDPAIVCLDDNANWAIALAGGHAGGPTSRVRTSANDLAHNLAELTGAHAVVTTASDGADLPSLDRLPGIRAQGDLASVGSALIDGQNVEITNKNNWPLPPALIEAVFAPQESDGVADEANNGTPTARIVVSDEIQCIDELAGPPLPTAVLRPESLVAGIGASSDATATDSETLLERVLAEAGLERSSLSAAATITSRAKHQSVASLGLPILAFSADQLAQVNVCEPSAVVQAAVGTPSVAEAAALLAAGSDAELVVTKQRSERVTVAIARRKRPQGSLSIVGLGPGTAWHRTPAAEKAVRGAQVVVGYGPYMTQASRLLTSEQTIMRSPIGSEADRARIALEAAAQGWRVALLCSGDAGVYGMASIALEMLEQHPGLGVAVNVVPGITAALAASAALGAPLGHDYLTVSLSDLHTPWQVIASRIEAAAATDLVVVMYNPRSLGRQWQLEEACRILRTNRAASTPVGLATNVGRDEERILHTTLETLDTELVGMTTTVIVGSSSTRLVEGKMVTPRGLPGAI